ncbi:MAG: PAS domain S-box protein [Syntrophomonadaceae bacterium]|nr:PAS domain S-box protein [Syntrophomonadaceae bacterium]
MSAGIGPEREIKNMAAVLEMVNGLFLIYDWEGMLKFVNQKLQGLLGYTAEDLQGMNIIDLVINRHKRRIRKVLRSEMPKGKERVATMPLLDRVGMELFVKTTTAPIFWQEKVVAEVVQIEDLTDRKRTEDELRESQRLTADIIESLPDPTLVIDEEGRVLYWNREAVEMTGFPASALVGKGDYEYALPFHGLRRPILIDMIMDEDLRFTNEYVYVKRDGNVLYTETKTGLIKGKRRILWGRAAPLFNTSGDIVGAIETVRDITARTEFEADLVQSNARLEAIFSGTVRALAMMTEKRDQYTAGHQQRVARLASAIGRAMGMGEDLVADINIAATLHDIGKLYVPLDILSQTGALTEIEYLFIKTHPAAGYDILKSIPFDAPIADIVLQHHERLDGSGYPQGLKGDEILIQARILAVADVVEAMASHRPYRASLGIEKALEEIKGNSGRLYDTDVVEACVRIFQDGTFSFDSEL